jgi:hypothetical protein
MIVFVDTAELSSSSLRMMSAMDNNGDKIEITLGPEHELKDQRITKMIVAGDELYYETEDGRKMTCREFTMDTIKAPKKEIEDGTN